MAEQGLNGTEISAVHKKISGKRVAKRVRSDMFSDAGFFGVFFDNTLDGARRESAEVSRSVYSLLITRVV